MDTHHPDDRYTPLIERTVAKQVGLMDIQTNANVTCRTDSHPGLLCTGY